MEAIESTFEKLTTLPMFQYERPATEDEIKHIERELSVVLPAQYVSFLRRFGYASWFGREIFGIRPIDPLTGRPATAISDCIKRTKRERQLAEADRTPLLDAIYVVVSTDGAGGNYVLFTCGSPLEGQVHWYNFEDQPEPHRVWNTFQEFLEYNIEDSLS